MIERSVLSLSVSLLVSSLGQHIFFKAPPDHHQHIFELLQCHYAVNLSLRCGVLGKLTKLTVSNKKKKKMTINRSDLHDHHHHPGCSFCLPPLETRHTLFTIYFFWWAFNLCVSLFCPQTVSRGLFRSLCVIVHVCLLFGNHHLMIRTPPVATKEYFVILPNSDG